MAKKAPPVTVAEKSPIEVEVSNLDFDFENPRLPTSKKGSSSNEVLRYMLTEAKVTDLMQSIAEQGYFEGEPLIAIPKGKDKYTIVEGNRRLAALKLLNKPNIAPIKNNLINEIVDSANKIPEKVPVIVYNTRDDVLEYLGYRHITGVDDWDPLAKARYLRQVENKYSKFPFEKRLKILARLIGSGTRGDYVKKLLLGYALYEEIKDKDFYSIPNLNEETLEFSLLTTAVSYSKISEYIGLNEDSFSGKLKGVKAKNLENLVTWIFKKNDEGFTRLGESRNLKILNAVVSSPKAIKAFSGGKSLDVARLYTSEPSETFDELISISLGRLRDARELLYLIEKPSSNVFDQLKEIQGISRSCFSDLQAKQEGDE
ncbi:MAG: ParB/Srx family N-terminal domain-containing protein [Cyclobacteriaceae bacterium]